MSRRSIGIELRSLNNLIGRFMENHANKKKVDSATRTNGWIIGYISDHPDKDIYQRDLEAEFSITRSTASKVVNLMVQKGFIERQSVVHDARLKKLVLTPKALEISELMHEDGEMVESVLVKGFTQEEITTLYGYIERMKQNVRF